MWNSIQVMQGFDRYIVQQIIKEMAKNRPIDTKGKKGFKVLVLNEVDKLSREAQHSLWQTMEKYSASCRLILCCNSSSKVTKAICSRCVNVRINAPTEEQREPISDVFDPWEMK